jgi:hypothetical protein
MASEPIRIAKSKLLIGEGIEEKRFFGTLLRHLGIQDVQVEQYGGKDGLRPFLQALPSIPGYSELRVLGITRDADKSCRATYQSVEDALKAAGLKPPATLTSSDTVFPKVHVFLLPDNTDAGMLEDLCLRSVSDDPGMPCVEEFFRCIEQRAHRQPSNRAKAHAHAWLSSQVIPNKRVGEAAEADYWRYDHPAFDPLKGFLRSL